MKYIDIHAHLSMPDYDTDRADVISRACLNEVAIINIGVDIQSSRMTVEMHDQYSNLHPHLYAIPGIHPDFVRERLFEIFRPICGVSSEVELTAESFHIANKNIVKEFQFAEEQILEDIDTTLAELAVIAEHKSVVGIGECGIDIFRLETVFEPFVPRILQLQEKLFVGQIEIALKLGKPIMIHARESYSEILSILDNRFISKGISLRGNVHFFAGTSEEARMFLDRGITVSFTGVITFAKAYEMAIREISLGNMMSETDSPFVSPVPHRGRRCEPSYVIEVVKKIAEIRGEPLEQVSQQLIKNAERVFGLNLVG